MEMNFDSQADIQCIICECGDNFPNEKLLLEHCAKNHCRVSRDIQTNSLSEAFYLVNEGSVNDVDMPLRKVTKPKSVPKPDVYYVTKNVVCEKLLMPMSDMMQSLEEHLEEHHAEEIMEDLVNMPIKIESVKEEEEEEINYEYQTIVTSENRIMKEHNYDKSMIVTEYYCDVCGKSFNKEAAVKIHVQMQHLNMNIKGEGGKLLCQFCDAQFTRKRWLVAHMESKHGLNVEISKNLPKKFACDTCDAAFTTAASLKYHVRIHTGEKPYQCETCNKRFAMPFQLQIHVRTHTGEKPYKCDICAKPFANRGAIWRHNKVHTGEKPYECGECLKRFSQSNSLKLHIRTVHMKLPAPYKSKARKMKDAAKVVRHTSSDQDMY